MKMPIVTVLAILLSNQFSDASQSRDYCKDFFVQANYTPWFKIISKSISFSSDKGVLLDKTFVSKAHLANYSSEVAHRIESDPSKIGSFYGVKEGIQVNEENGDPRNLKITEDYLENYGNNFMPKFKSRKALEPKLHLFEYNFSFRSGTCIPTSVVELNQNGRKVLFDFDLCTQPEKSPKSSQDLDCHRLEVFNKMFGDEHLKYSWSNSQTMKLPVVR